MSYFHLCQFVIIKEFSITHAVVIFNNTETVITTSMSETISDAVMISSNRIINVRCYFVLFLTIHVYLKATEIDINSTPWGTCNANCTFQYHTPSTQAFMLKIIAGKSSVPCEWPEQWRHQIVELFPHACISCERRNQMHTRSLQNRNDTLIHVNLIMEFKFEHFEATSKQ